MKRFFRGLTILWVVWRYGLDDLVLSSFKHPFLNSVSKLLRMGRKWTAPRGQRLREALEQLGPIFVKFGQVLSTRRDLLPPDVAEALEAEPDAQAFFESLATFYRKAYLKWIEGAARRPEIRAAPS